MLLAGIETVETEVHKSVVFWLPRFHLLLQESPNRRFIKMDKKIVGITLILTALFVVGGVVLETHGGGSIIGDFSMMEGD